MSLLKVTMKMVLVMLLATESTHLRGVGPGAFFVEGTWSCQKTQSLKNRLAGPLIITMPSCPIHNLPVPASSDLPSCDKTKHMLPTSLTSNSPRLPAEKRLKQTRIGPAP